MSTIDGAEIGVTLGIDGRPKRARHAEGIERAVLDPAVGDTSRASPLRMSSAIGRPDQVEVLEAPRFAVDEVERAEAIASSAGTRS